MALSKFFSIKLQSINMDQMLETDKQQDQERSILVNFWCQFPRNKVLIIFLICLTLLKCKLVKISVMDKFC